MIAQPAAARLWITGHRFEGFATAPGWAKLLRFSLYRYWELGIWATAFTGRFLAWTRTNEIANWEWIGPSRAAIF